MSKEPNNDHPIHDLLRRRWSPYQFSAAPVAAADLRSIFEAARWAPSSYNEQPWRFLVAERADEAEFQRVLSCLVETNQVWAQHAAVLAIAVTVRRFARNGKENRACEHDLGLAAAQLTVEATARGLFVHQMIGIDPDRARAVFSIPEEATPLTGIAIGHTGPAAAALDGSYQARDEATRTRKPLSELVFRGSWGKPAPL
jgi:nitroreductase